MSDPLSYPSTTPRYALPLLFPGQAQKEAFVNGAHALADVLLHPAVEGERADPPAAPVDGECWLVAPDASAAFAGRAGCIAGRESGIWLFAPPRPGMRLYDRAAGQYLTYDGAWRRVATPPPAEGGQTIDAEARAGLAALVTALRECGIFASR